MASIFIENSEDRRGVRFRVTSVGQLLDNPELIIRWHGANQILSATGWGNAAATHKLAQALNGQDLILTPPAVIASLIDPGTPIEIEISALKATIPALRWPALGPDLKIEIGSGGPVIDIGTTVGEKKLAPEEVPGTETGDQPPTYKPPGPPTGSRGTTGTTQGTSSGTGSGNPFGTPPAPPPPPQRGIFLPLLVAFLLGCGVGGGSWFVYEKYQIANGTLPRQSTLAQRCDVAAVAERAFVPFRIGLGSLPATSPKGKRVDDISRPGAPDRARKLYNEGQRETQASGAISEEAVFWFRQAAQMCDAHSLYSLGRAYWSGSGVPAADQIAGFQLMRMSDALGLAEARAYLRQLVQGGKVPGLDPATPVARRWNATP